MVKISKNFVNIYKKKLVIEYNFASGKTTTSFVLDMGCKDY